MNIQHIKCIVRGLRPLTCRACSSSSSPPSSRNGQHHEYFYKTDLSYSGVVLGEPTSSMRVEQQNQMLSPEQYSHQNFVNERTERVNLREIKGGAVKLQRDDETGIAKIMISNPEKANALSGSMMLDLADAITILEKWKEGKAVIFHGDPAGGNFCGGVDLAFMKSPLPNLPSMMCLFMHNVLSRLQRLPMINVAAISGSVIGGGAELITACDFRVMEPNAKICFVQAKMGVSPGLGGGVRLVKLLGAQKALKLLLSSNVIQAEEAKELGFSDDTITYNNDISKSAQDWLKMYTFAPTPVVRALKSVITAGRELELDQALSRERHIFTSLLKEAIGLQGK